MARENILPIGDNIGLKKITTKNIRTPVRTRETHSGSCRLKIDFFFCFSEAPPMLCGRNMTMWCSVPKSST